MTSAEQFWRLFEDRAGASYDYDPNRSGLKYLAVNHGLTLLDIERHLAGRLPSVLSIPILPTGLCHFACGDCDRHGAADAAIDFAAVARRIAELGLPLIITRSKSPKSCHIWLFFLEADGFSAATARRLIQHYMHVLGIDGSIEIFPKQETLKPDQIGSGINLPFFGETRTALGKDGQELSLEEFLVLAHERASFGVKLAERDLADSASGHVPSSEKRSPLPASAIRAAHAKHLAALRESNTQGGWNNALNRCTWYAGAAFAAGVLDGSAEDIQVAIRGAASAIDGWNERLMERTIERVWEEGMAEPLEVLDAGKKHDEALERLTTWLYCELKRDDGRTWDDIYSDLALMTAEEYATMRKDAAKQLDIQVSDLDDFVSKRRPKRAAGEDEDAAYQSIVALFKPSEPWTEPVDGAELLADISRTLRRFIVFREMYDSDVMATWCVGTHVYMEFNIFSRFGFTSALPDSGKTTCLDCAEHLCHKAIRGDSITSSIFFRVQDAHHPTWLLDELDTFIHENPELIGMLNSGHRQGGYAWRNRTNADGSVTPERFATYGALAYAMLGHPPATLFSRTVMLRLESKNAEQIVEDFNPDEFPEQGETMTVLRRKIARWAEDHKAEIKAAQPDTGKLNNRKRNNWRALLKIGMVAGGTWTEKLLTAAGSPPLPTKKTVQEKFLRDIRNIFHTRNVDKIPTEVLIADLLMQRDSGWNRFHNGREPLDAADLAAIAIDFGIEPKPFWLSADLQLKLFQVKDGKGQTKRGYTLESFQRFIETSLTGGPEEVELAREYPF